MERLCPLGQDRFVGTAGHRKAVKWLEGLLKSWGLAVESQDFHVEMTMPVRWKVELDTGKGFREVEATPGIGSPSVDLTAEVLPVGYGKEEDYPAEGGDGEGKIHLARLWKSHETAKVRLAALKGASALAWYNEYFDALYSGACDYRASPIPGFSLKRSDAEGILAAGGGRIRLRIKSRKARVRCRNLIAQEGEGGPAAVLASHHDSRPWTPGASDDASGVAVMLAFIRAGYGRGLARPVRYLFADCEEQGCVGAEVYADGLYHANRLREISCVVNLDAVGWPNLCLISRDRESVMDERLTHLAEEVFASLGYRAEAQRSKTGRSNHTPFARRGIRTLWLSDYPNYIRHSPIDNPFNIDYPTMAMTVEALRGILARI